MNKMSAKMEAALKTIALALVTAENGEMVEMELEKLQGVGLPQMNALVARGILARRVDTYQGVEGHWFYSVA